MSPLNLYLLGPPRIELDGTPIQVDTRKAVALLVYLAITREHHRRDALLDLLWPEYDPDHGRAALRRTLSTLRNVLPGDWLEISREDVELNPNANVRLDVDRFHGDLAACGAHGHPPSEVCPACLDRLEAAVALYRGDFLAGFGLKDSVNFDDWQFYQSQALRGELSGALEKLVRGHGAAGRLEAAINYARRWLELDRLNEAAHCQLMQLYDWSGQRSAALRQYQECVQALQTDLAVPPQAATTALYQAILQGRGPRPPAGPDLQRPERGQAGQPDARAARVTLPGDEPSTAQSARSVLVARERELEQLGRHLDAALAGQGRPVFVIGGAGRGKTVLIHEFARRAQARSPDLLFAGGNCNAHTGLGDPYLPFREILGMLTGDVDALWAAGAITQEHARRLWDALPQVAQALVQAGPDLIETLIPGAALTRRAAAYTTGETRPSAAWQSQLEELVALKTAIPHDPNLHQTALFEQCARVMAALAQTRPVLLAVDDLQWADDGSINLLFHLGRRLAGRRILIVGAYRPEEVTLGRHGERHPLDGVINEFRRTFGDTTIDLAQAQNRLFVGAYLDTEPNRLSAEFRETLYRRTGGHPLFTVELLRGMQARGDLVQNAEGQWIEGPSLDWEALPARVEAVIAERIARLDSSAQEALRVASVEGEIFTAEIVAKVRSTDEREMVARLSGELERGHRLVHAHEIQRLGARRVSRYRFRHFLFQHYLYHSLDPVERAHLHEAVGTALEELYGAETEQMAVSLAHHFQEAGIAEKAATYLLQAGENATRSSAYEAAISHLNRGLELLQRLPPAPERDRLELELDIALGLALILTKSHSAPEVELTYVRAKELCEQAGNDPQRFQVLLGLRRFYLHRGQLARAHQLGEQLLALGQRMPDPLPASRAHMMHADTLYHLGEFVQARDHSRQGLALYDPQQCRSHMFLYGNDTGIGCRVYEAVALWHLGCPDQALTSARQMVALARELSHPFTLVFSLYFAACVYQLCRDARSAQACTSELLSIANERGFSLYRAWGTAVHGWALAELGDLEAGIAQMRQSLAISQEIGMRLSFPHSSFFLAEAYGQAGQVDEGLRVLDVALGAVEETEERAFEAELYRLKGELMLRKGHDASRGEAEMCFQRALDLARRSEARSWELRAAMSLSRLWHEQGRTAQACELLQSVYAWFTEGWDTADLKEAQALLNTLGS